MASYQHPLATIIMKVGNGLVVLVEKKEVESRNFHNGGYKKIEALVKTIILGCTMKLAQILGKDRAMGGESESPMDVDIPHVVASEQFVDAASGFDDEASQVCLRT
ncbi:hypothetical protein LINPERPRIM_LOCUS7011 [Linum perenne]